MQFFIMRTWQGIPTHVLVITSIETYRRSHTIIVQKYIVTSSAIKLYTILLNFNKNIYN